MKKLKLPRHLGIIMDGNGRWAKKRHLPRIAGHKQGLYTLEKIAKDAYNIGISILTVFAFSTENWNRPDEEVKNLFFLANNYLENNISKPNTYHIKIRFIGRKDRIPLTLKEKFSEIEEKTKNEDRMLLNIAFDYGSRDEIIRTFSKMKEDNIPFTEDNVSKYLDTPDLDFLIRTGSEKRLSNFLLWQASYAELYFTDTYWPSFNTRKFHHALKAFAERKRRYGGIK